MKSNRIILALTFVIFMGILSMASAQKSVRLSDGQIENIVKRSCQYVAMYPAIITEDGAPKRPGTTMLSA